MISIKVARSLYTDPNDAKIACELVEAFRLSRRPSPQSTSPANQTHITIPNLGTTPGAAAKNLGRNKAYVTASFKDEDKYSGSVSGTVPLHRMKNRFLDALRDQSIPKGDEVDLLHCCLSGMALDFYYKSIPGICQNIEEAFKILEKHFKSFQHQAQARTYLKNLSIGAVMTEKDCTMMIALETIHNCISETAPNCGKEYQHYVQYCDFLEGAVMGQPWAKSVIQERLTPNPNERFDYNTFYSKLCAALTSYEGTHKDDFKTNAVDVGAATFFGERYASRPSRKQKPSRYRPPPSGPRLNVASMLRPPNRIKTRMSASQLAQLKSRTKCLRCHETGHWRHECPNKSRRPMQDVLLSLVKEIGNDGTAVAKTLWALAEDDEEFDAYVALCNDASHNNSAPSSVELDAQANTFHALLNSIHALLNSIPENQTFTDQDACQELETVYKEFSNEFLSNADEDQSTNFGLPM